MSEKKGWVSGKYTEKETYFFFLEITGLSFKLLGKCQYHSGKKKKAMLKMMTPAVLITIDTGSYL